MVGGRNSEVRCGERGKERLVCSRARFPRSACEGGEGHANHARSVAPLHLVADSLEGETVQGGWRGKELGLKVYEG